VKVKPDIHEEVIPNRRSDRPHTVIERRSSIVSGRIVPERHHSPHASYSHHSPRASFRYVEAEHYEPRRSGSVIYVNPRHSTASYRSGRERVVVVDDSGRRREYYR